MAKKPSGGSNGHGGNGKLKLTEPEDLQSALAPQIERARQFVTAEADAHRLGKRERRELKDGRRLADPNQNVVLAGRPRATPPGILQEDDVVEAVDAILAEDDVDLKTRRRTLGRHAKGRVLKDKSAGARARLDNTLGEAEWLSVYDGYRTSAIPATLARLTGLRVEVVEHLLDAGVKRLNLPPIRVHATRTDVMHALVKQSNPELEDHSSADDAPPEALEVAITSRAVRESAAAQQCLDAAIDANEIFASFVKKILDAVRQGNIEVGEKIHMGHLESLTKALGANTQALERAVKLSRLVRGETTDLVGAQINLLLQACSTEELEEAERSGGLPRRLVNRFAGDEQMRRIVDATAEEVMPSPAPSPAPRPVQETDDDV